MSKRWAILSGLLILALAAIIINGQIVHRYAANYVVRLDMHALTQALGDYANAHNGRLPSSWEDLERADLLVLGEKAAKSTSRPQSANVLRSPDRCHWKSGALVYDYIRKLNENSTPSMEQMLFFSDDLSPQDNLKYNIELLEHWRFKSSGAMERK